MRPNYPFLGVFRYSKAWPLINWTWYSHVIMLYNFSIMVMILQYLPSTFGLYYSQDDVGVPLKLRIKHTHWGCMHACLLGKTHNWMLSFVQHDICIALYYQKLHTFQWMVHTNMYMCTYRDRSSVMPSYSIIFSDPIIIIHGPPNVVES